jgi:hypothetical protein
MIYAKAFYSSLILPQMIADGQFKDQITRFQMVDPKFRRNSRLEFPRAALFQRLSQNWHESGALLTPLQRWHKVAIPAIKFK